MQSIVFVMSMLLFCAICFEQNSSAPLIELSAENNSTLECADSDLDLKEEIQIVSNTEVFSVVKFYMEHRHFHFTQTTVEPFYPVWQPPKLS